MRKYTGIFFLLLFLSSAAHAADVVYDGSWWLSMGHIAKEYFLVGFKVGAKDASKNSTYHDLDEKDFLNTIDGLDLFYKDHQNREVRFHVAVYIVLKKIHGGSIDTIEKLTQKARQNPFRIPENP
jgi:hypothetical protein